MVARTGEIFGSRQERRGSRTDLFVVSHVKMVPSSKWIDGAVSDQPVGGVAREVLQARLETVWHWLPLAAERSEADVEYVHRLRVSTRRAVEAVRVFRKMLRPSHRREVKERLRQIRRTANDARDLDVLAERLAHSTAGNGLRGVTAFLERISLWRKEAQRPIVAVYRELLEERSDYLTNQLLEEIRFSGKRLRKREPTFGEKAPKFLKRVSKKFNEAARGDFSNIEALHAFRLAGKRLRYTMEILAGAFDPAFRSDLYPKVEQLQDYLGKVNDHATAQTRFQEWLGVIKVPEERACVESLLATEKAALVESRDALLGWWTPERRDLLGTSLKAYCFKPGGSKRAVYLQM